MRKIDNYLKSFRKQSGLSQDDLAFLLNKKSICSISKIENNKIAMDVRTLILLCLIYDKNIMDIFPKSYEKYLIELLERVSYLTEKYHKLGDEKNILKLLYLERIMKRIVTKQA